MRTPNAKANNQPVVDMSQNEASKEEAPEEKTTKSEVLSDFSKRTRPDNRWRIISFVSCFVSAALLAALIAVLAKSPWQSTGR